MRIKKRMRKAGVLLFAAICLTLAFSVRSRGENAFIVEEEAVIGGEEIQSSPLQPSSQPLLQPPTKPPSQNPATLPKQSTSLSEQAGDLPSQEKPEKPIVSDNSVQNHTSFTAPARKIHIKEEISQNSANQSEKMQKNKNVDKAYEAAEEETTVHETESKSPLLPDDTKYFQVAGLVCLILGIARILWRICIPCRKL